MRSDATLETIFQKDIIAQMQSHGWLVGSGIGYNREKALYEQDVLGFVQKTQDKEWQKFKNIFPNDTERHFLDTVVAQLKKADINATDVESRSYGTLGVLRHGIRTRGVRFSFCQFKPEHGLNPELNQRYQQNICRVVPELVYTRFYEFMSQIVEYDDKELEKLSLFARNLRPLLREQVAEEDEIDLSNVAMTHYRLSKLRQQDIQLKADSTEHKLEPGNELGTAKPKDKKEDFLSQILSRMNDLFVTDNLTEKDMINYALTIADKMSENTRMMKQIHTNTREQAMLGEFDTALDDAVLDSNAAHMEQMTQLMSDPAKMKQFAHIIYDVLVNRQKDI